MRACRSPKYAITNRIATYPVEMANSVQMFSMRGVGRGVRGGYTTLVEYSTPPRIAITLPNHPFRNAEEVFHMATASIPTGSVPLVARGEEKRVIFASSLGTVFEWYDFYLYATLAPFFAALFFP